MLAGMAPGEQFLPSSVPRREPRQQTLRRLRRFLWLFTGGAALLLVCTVLAAVAGVGDGGGRAALTVIPGPALLVVVGLVGLWFVRHRPEKILKRDFRLFGVRYRE
jgi:hypothetical protein